MLSSLAALSYAPPQPNAAAWAVIQKQFSAVTIGLAFTDDKTGYTSFTDGASAPVITKTVDGGATWSKTAVNTTGAMLMPMGFASGTGAGALAEGREARSRRHVRQDALDAIRHELRPGADAHLERPLPGRPILEERPLLHPYLSCVRRDAAAHDRDVPEAEGERL